MAIATATASAAADRKNRNAPCKRTTKHRQKLIIHIGPTIASNGSHPCSVVTCDDITLTTDRLQDTSASGCPRSNSTDDPQLPHHQHTTIHAPTPNNCNRSQTIMLDRCCSDQHVSAHITRRTSQSQLRPVAPSYHHPATAPMRQSNQSMRQSFNQHRWHCWLSVLLAIGIVGVGTPAVNCLPQQQQQQQQPLKQLFTSGGNADTIVVAAVAAAAAAAAAPAPPSPFIGCTTCRERSQVEDQSLDFFKSHILKRLDMERPPNMTANGVPQIADDVIREFYKRYGYRYIRLSGNDDGDGNVMLNAGRRGGGGGGGPTMSIEAPPYDTFDENGMQADEPVATSDSGGGGGGGGGSNSGELNYYESYGGGQRDSEPDVEFDEDEDEEEQFFSTTDSIFAFPKLLKARHRGDILEFSFKPNQHLAVQEAIFHLHVHGLEWLAQSHHPAGAAGAAAGGADMPPPATSSASQTLQSLLAAGTVPTHRQHLAISLNRLVRQRYTRTDSDYVGAIPKGYGATIRFNVTDMVLDWMRHGNSSQEMVIKTEEPWMRTLLSLTTNSATGPYIEVLTKDVRKKRSKRSSISYNCKESDKENRCCRYPLRVDFRKFGWEWIIAPDVYEAFYCSGECPINFQSKSGHTYVTALSASVSHCCSPRKLSPLSLLYFDENKQVIHSIIPNMAVERCSCS